MTPEKHREAMASMSIAHITSPAENRMRARNAREQHALFLAEMSREQSETIPDADDESFIKRAHFQ